MAKGNRAGWLGSLDSTPLPGIDFGGERKAMDGIETIVVTVKRRGPDYVYKQELELTFAEYQTFMRTGELPERFDEHGEDARISTAIVPG